MGRCSVELIGSLKDTIMFLIPDSGVLSCVGWLTSYLSVSSYRGMAKSLLTVLTDFPTHTQAARIK